MEHRDSDPVVGPNGPEFVTSRDERVASENFAALCQSFVDCVFWPGTTASSVGCQDWRVRLRL